MRIQADISIGDWIDRLTILEIKLGQIGERDKLDNIKREYETLLAAAPGGLLADPDIAELRARLKGVNAELWRIEDEIRLKERARAFDEEFIALARAVYRHQRPPRRTQARDQPPRGQRSCRGKKLRGLLSAGVALDPSRRRVRPGPCSPGSAPQKS